MGFNMNEETQQKTLLEIAQEINDARKNRPTYEDAINAVYLARMHLRQAMKCLDDIFNRENRYRMCDNIYMERKSEFDKVM